MDPIAIWKWSLVGGGAVIVVVAVLLLAIIYVARSIDRHAGDVWVAGKNIAGNTVSIWMLETTNEVAGEILRVAQSIDASLKSLAGGK